MIKYQYQIGTVIKYYDESRKGIAHYGEVIEIRIGRDAVRYVTQDGKIVLEANVKGAFSEVNEKQAAVSL